MKKECKPIMSADELVARGYTYSSAARALKCSTTHLYLVATGARVSRKLAAKLRKLPKRTLNLRERITTSKKGAKA